MSPSLGHDLADAILLPVSLRPLDVLDLDPLLCSDTLRVRANRLPERLRELGTPEESLARLSAPIGLDLGARTPEETAVAVAAEIISLTWNGSGRRLTELESPIHR